MSRSYRAYTDEDIIAHAQKATSMAQLLKKLDLRPTGGNYDNMRKNLQRLGLKCEHWKGQAWNKDEQLKSWSEYTRGSQIKPHLIRERGRSCERCDRSEWEGQPIPLELEHKNGDKTDHRYENLALLCCNCHALTPTWKNRKRTPR